MSDAYAMSRASRDKVQKAIDRSNATLLSPGRQFINPANPPAPLVHQDGIVYGAIDHGETNEPKAGYVKFDKLRTSPLGYVEADAEPTRVYNISTTRDFADGDRVRCYWHQNCVDGEGDDKVQLGAWTVGDDTSEAETIGRLYICRAGALSVADNDDLQLLPLGTVYNFDTATFGVDKPNKQIELKKIGHYAIGYGAEFITGSSGSSTTGTLERFSTYFQATTAAFSGSGSVVECSRIKLASYCDTDGNHLIDKGSNEFYTRVESLTLPTYVRFVCQKDEFINGGELNMDYVRVFYLGSSASAPSVTV